MRFIIDIVMKGEPPFFLPIAYRKHIVKLIRDAVRSCMDAGNVYGEYWSNFNTNKVKPFTFYLSTPHSRFVNLEGERFLRLNNPSIRLLVSSIDLNFLSVLRDGLRNIGSTITLFNYPVELKNFFLRKVKSIHSNPVKFRILSPVVVRDIEITGNSRKLLKGYLSCNQSDFESSLIYSIRTLCSRLLYDTENAGINNINLDTSCCIPTFISHYREVIPATKGVIGINADKEILELIYRAGLGARRSQGFGMLELLGKSEYKYIS